MGWKRLVGREVWDILKLPISVVVTFAVIFGVAVLLGVDVEDITAVWNNVRE